MRLFIGLEIPPAVKEKIWDFVLPLQKSPKGWERPNDYHQTLLFIGETDAAELDGISERFSRLAVDPFELETSGFRFFGRRIMYLGLAPSADLLRLKDLVHGAFPEKIDPHAKPFTPHITVKRWQRYEYDDLEAGVTTRAFAPLRFSVTGIALFKSEKDPEGNKYHVIQRSGR